MAKEKDTQDITSVAVSEKEIEAALNDVASISTGSGTSKITEKHKLLLLAVLQRKESLPLMDCGKLLFKWNEGRAPSSKSDDDRKKYQVWARRFKKLVESEDHLKVTTDTPYKVEYVK